MSARPPDAAADTRYAAFASSRPFNHSREPIMTCNVGNIDRALRIIVGLALIAWALAGGPVWAWIGVLPLATGLFKFCPAYTLLGMNTCGTKK